MAAVEKIRTRSVPKTGEQIPVIGIGTWQTFDVGLSAAERGPPLTEVLRLFFEAGGKAVDLVADVRPGRGRRFPAI